MIWLSYLLKTMLIQLIAYGSYKILLDREPLGHWKRAYLLGSLLLSLTIPFFTVPQLFASTMAASPADAGTTVIALPDMDFSGTPEVSSAVEVYSLSDLLWLLVLCFYGVGALVYFLRLLQGLWSVKNRVEQATSAEEIAPGIHLLGLPQPTATHTFLRWIFFHEAAPPESEVLAHELAHARQWHTLDRLFVGALRVVFWFNPLLRYYEQAIRENHELLADQAVLQQGVNPVSYQQQLLNALRRPASPAFSSGVDFHLTKKRFQMMHLSKVSRSRTLVKLSTAGLLWVVLLLCFGQPGYAQTDPEPAPAPMVYHSGNIKQAVPTAKQLLTWGRNEDNSIHIDARPVNSSALRGYQPEDFSQYYVVKSPEGSGHQGLHVYLFTEKEYPWPNVPPPPPPFPPMPPGAAPQAPPAPPAPPVSATAPPAPPAPPAAPGVAPPRPPSAPNLPPPPPPMDWNEFEEKMPSAAQLREWQDSEKFGVWVDRRQVPNAELTSFSPENFSFFRVSKLMKNAKHYGKYTYQVNLMTKERLAELRRRQRD